MCVHDEALYKSTFTFTFSFTMSENAAKSFRGIRTIVITTVNLIFIHSPVFWLCLQETVEASYVATMKTIRQVKTVFIIFIAFVCCWIPYIVVLLYDSSDSLPLPVHLYTSMLAHLHASLNFAIYGLNDCNLAEKCRRISDQLITCCSHQTAPSNVCGRHFIRRHGRRARIVSAVDVNRTLVTVECYQLQDIGR